jgi:aspartate/methionine/tyrosine aminotransferase
MSFRRTSLQSDYLHWAKTGVSARFNLATSGVLGYPLAELGVQLSALEINGPPGYGTPKLEELLAQKSGVHANQVMLGIGTAMANHLAMAAVVEPGDEVLIEEPTYEPLLSVAAYLGARIRRFPRRFADRFRIDPDAVKENTTEGTRLIVLTNLHNPSSVFTDEETLCQVGQIADALGARVLVDEVYLELLLGSEVRSAVHLGEQFLVTSSLTKAYGLGCLRCGWILSEAKLAQRMARLNDLFGATGPYPAELLSIMALERLDRIRARAQALLAANRKSLDAFLQAHPELPVVNPGFGTTVFPKLPGKEVDDFLERLRVRWETSAVPGRFFEMPKHFRIGIGGESATTAEGFARLSNALKDSNARE